MKCLVFKINSHVLENLNKRMFLGSIYFEHIENKRILKDRMANNRVLFSARPQVTSFISVSLDEQGEFQVISTLDEM